MPAPSPDDSLDIGHPAPEAIDFDRPALRTPPPVRVAEVLKTPPPAQISAPPPGDSVEIPLDGMLEAAQAEERAEGHTRREDGEDPFAALEEALEPKAQAWLVARLERLGPEALAALAQQELPLASPRRATFLVEAAFGVEPGLGLRVARAALKVGDVKVKTQVIRSLVEHPSTEVVALLAHVAGWKGDKYTTALLGLSGESTRWAHRLQLAAVGALGLTKSPVAARPLLDLCTRGKLFSDQATEDLQIGAAQALLTNGSPEASRALDEIANHKKRAVRDIARRVIAGRR